jgi:hypothetical protein
MTQQTPGRQKATERKIKAAERYADQRTVLRLARTLPAIAEALRLRDTAGSRAVYTYLRTAQDGSLRKYQPRLTRILSRIAGEWTHGGIDALLQPQFIEHLQRLEREHVRSEKAPRDERASWGE